MTAPAATSQQWIPISKKALTSPHATMHMLMAAVPVPWTPVRTHQQGKHEQYSATGADRTVSTSKMP